MSQSIAEVNNKIFQNLKYKFRKIDNELVQPQSVSNFENFLIDLGELKEIC